MFLVICHTIAIIIEATKVFTAKIFDEDMAKDFELQGTFSVTKLSGRLQEAMSWWNCPVACDKSLTSKVVQHTGLLWRQ